MSVPSPIAVGQSSVHGVGAFAARPLAEGERLATYEGRRYTDRQSKQRDWNSALTYLFSLSNGSMIDGADGGNATRYLNHSCSPNVVAYEETKARRKDIVFYALRPIDVGEELFLDYSLIVEASLDGAGYDCACRSPQCRGTMVASVLA